MRAILPSTDPRQPSPRIGDLPDPVPGPGEVLVAVEAAGLNHADLLQLRGQYPPPPGESEVPGLECAGKVIGRGSGLWQPGARVMALLGGGGHATRVAIPSGQLMPLPDNLSCTEGAAIPEAALTAWTNLVAEGGLQEGESVLISGASGGMGSFAVQLARELGARVLAAGRDRDRLELLRTYGVEEICVAGPHLAHQVLDATGGRGVDLVLDFVGGSELPGHLASLRERGRLVLVGLLAGGKAEVNLGPVLSRRLRITGSVLRPRSRAEKAQLVSDFQAFALPRLKDGRLRPVVDRVVPLEKAADAYRALERGGVFGKIVLSMT
ncbi:MAG TPA: NAD(P)H-quinone oxidoreductase [Thermoanaerobaculia bacterium]|nr:NAD(P)H-quinone oxidoreductase [Thermoanaerobaculia bacterium]